MEQAQVNQLAAQIRREVIYFLLKNEFLEHRQSVPEKETLAYEIERIYRIPCETKLLKKLFADAREYREERGLFPAPVTIADLEGAIKNRAIGYAVTQGVKFGFLPFKADKELRSLPAVKSLLEGYRLLLKAGKPVLLPQAEGSTGDALQITRQLAAHLKGAEV